MLRQSHANAIVIQGLIAQKGLDCMKSLISWEFENKPEGEGEGGEGEKTLLLRAPLVAIGAQKAQVYAGCFWVLLGNLKTNGLNHLKI